MSKKPSLAHQPKSLEMSKASIIEYTRQKRHLYQTHPHRAYRIQLLTQYCETTGFDRKYAQKLLTGKRKGDGTGRGKNAGRHLLYTEGIKKIIQAIWKSSEQPCGKRLKQTIPLLLPSYEKRHGQLDETTRELLIKISPAQIDRLLSENKARNPGKKWWLKRPGIEAIREKIAVRAQRWQVEECGWLEVDSVALCGGDMSGGFIWILTVTDIWSGWTEIVPMWNRASKTVLNHYEPLMKRSPFIWKGIDSDNGGEFISWETLKWQQIRKTLGHPIELTRSRPYHKNDQSRVEQKNYTHVRQFLGYERIDYQQLLEPLSEVCRAWSLWNNLYRVQMKQLESRREGTRRRRRHDPTPQSAARRIMEMKETEPSIRKALEKLYHSNDPLDLHDECERGLQHIYQLLAILRKNEPMSEWEADELCLLQGKLTLRYAPFQLALKKEKTTLHPAS